MKKKKSGILPQVLLAALLFASISCRTTRTINGEKVRPMNAKKLYTRVTSEYLSYNNLSIKYNCDFDDGESEKSFNGTLRLKRDSIIWISIVPALGIEIARIQLTPDSIMFMNKLKNEYFVEPYDYFENKYQVDLTFEDLQAIFTNEIFLYSETDEETNTNERQRNKDKERNRQIKDDNDEPDADFFRKTFIADTDSNLYVLRTHRKRKIKKQIRRPKNNDFLVESIYVAPEIFKICRINVTDYTENRELNISYNDFMDINEDVFPYKLIIALKNGESKYSISMKYNKVNVNTDISFPFKITDKYQRISER